MKVYFDGGQPPVQAKVLIGADGYFSRIRKQCLNDGPPMFAVSLSKCKALAKLCIDLQSLCGGLSTLLYPALLQV